MSSEPLIDGRIVRGLTLWRPWPWAFTDADKDVENRPWALPRFMRGGWLALHSGKRWDAGAAEAMAAGDFTDAARACPQRDEDHRHSVITCLARVPDCRRKESIFREDGEEWHFGPYCWSTPRDQLVVLPEPVPCRGAQGLWKLPPDVFEAVRAGYEQARTS